MTVDYIVNHFIDNEFKVSYEIKSPDRYIPANRENAINIISESLLITHNITKWVIDKRFPATNSNQNMMEFEEEIVGVDTGFLDEDNLD